MRGILLTLLSCIAAAGIKHQKRDATPGISDTSNGDVLIFKCDSPYAPKVMIVSLFEPEMAVWHKHYNFTHNVTLPGLSPLFPHIFCDEEYELCQAVTGESEINAASTIMALSLSPLFDLSKTYFVIGGIAGVNPYEGSLGSIAFARYTVQVALEYEIDPREMPSNWTTGYWGYGTDQPGEYPGNFYGTEVFELNDNLRHRAHELASKVELDDGKAAAANRVRYDYAPANQGPTALLCDTATSDVYYTGKYLGEAFGNWTHILTNGTGVYCMTAQEDSAVLEALVRAGKYGIIDYSRVVLFRTASDFDRPPKGFDPVTFFNSQNTGGFAIAIENIYRGSNPFVQDIITNWDSVYEDGSTYAPDNYVGDVLGTLNASSTPDFGYGNYRTYNYLA